MKDLYKILDVNKSSTSNDIKRAYKKMAFKHHPDKGGTEEKFKEISEAYEILSDDQKRKRYDVGGYDSVQQSDGGNPMDMFNNLFGGGGMMFNMMGGNPFTEMMGQSKQPSVKTEYIDVTLDDLYTGAKKTKIIETTIKCLDCSGNGYLQNGKQMCSACNGTKMIVQTMQMGPMIQQSRRPCHVCYQKGYTIIPGYECNSCKCTGTKKVKKKYNLNINKGNVSGKDIQLKGKGDYIPDIDVQGDLLIQLREVPYENFNRKNSDGSQNRHRPKEISHLEKALEKELETWKANIEIKISPPDIDNIFKVGTSVSVDDGMSTSIERKGNGLQRALIFALIKTWAKLLISKKDQNRIKNIDSFYKEKINLKTFTEINMNKFFYYNGKQATIDILNFRIIKSKKYDKNLLDLIELYKNKIVPTMPIKAEEIMTKYQITEGKYLGSKLKLIEELSSF